MDNLSRNFEKTMAQDKKQLIRFWGWSVCSIQAMSTVYIYIYIYISASVALCTQVSSSSSSSFLLQFSFTHNKQHNVFKITT